MSVKGGADLFNVGSMAADGFVELVPGDAKLFRPEGNVIWTPLCEAKSLNLKAD